MRCNAEKLVTMEKLLKILMLPIVLGVSYSSEFFPELSTNGVPCIFRELFDIECWGCGMTRSIIALLHGDFSRSFSFHRFGLVVLCLITFISLKEIYFTAKNRKKNVH